MKRSLAFFLLAIAITWSFWIPVLLTRTGVWDLELPPWSYLLGGLGPIGAATLMAWLDKRMDGIKKLYASILKWKVKYHWYLIVITLPMLIHFLIVLLEVLVFAMPFSQISVDFASFIPSLIFSSAFMLVEEVGWRGFALPNLQRNRSALSASLIVGLMWGIWHIPLLFLKPEQFGLAQVNSELVTVLIYTANTVALSVVFTWVFNSTGGSLLLTTLFHGSLNSVGSTYSFSSDVSANHFWIPLAIILTIIGIIITSVTNRETLSRGNKIS